MRESWQYRRVKELLRVDTIEDGPNPMRVTIRTLVGTKQMQAHECACAAAVCGAGTEALVVGTIAYVVFPNNLRTAYKYNLSPAAKAARQAFDRGELQLPSTWHLIPPYERKGSRRGLGARSGPTGKKWSPESKARWDSLAKDLEAARAQTQPEPEFVGVL